MQLFASLIRAIERKARSIERRALYRELIDHGQAHNKRTKRVAAIMDRLHVLSLHDDKRAAASRIRPMSFQHAPEAVDFANCRAKVRTVVEDDACVPDGLVSEWRAPV